MTLWVDVGDLMGYSSVFRRPSGVQRVVFALCQALAARTDAAIGFVRHGDRGFETVAWGAIAALFDALADDAAPPPPVPAWRLQLQALGALLTIPRSFLPAAGSSSEAAMQRGDVLLVAGAGWADPDHVAQVTRAQARHGVVVALLVYDIIPALRPEWFDPAQSGRFRRWLDGMLAVSDRLLAISNTTAQDVAAYRAATGLPDRAVHVVRLGDGLPAGGPALSADIGQPYALFVSTIEIRKNHALLVDVWRRLLCDLGPQRVPALVFAGRQGGLCGDLMRQLAASDVLGGHVILRPGASDAALAALYRGCRFTLFPSLYEGWGLPVAESLAFGRPCLASRASSLPEVGGDLVRYFDPLDPDDCARAVAAVLADPDGLAAWEARITRDYRPVPWSRTAAMVLDGVA